MTDLAMKLDEHRIPDGTRPLIITTGRPSRSLIPAYLDPVNAVERNCWSVLFAQVVPEFTEPASCRRRIVAGDHYLRWVEFDVAGQPTGRTFAYCAPCAVSNWEFVAEASL